MTYNIINSNSIDQNYQSGLLHQRNDPHAFYQDSSCRSNLADFKLSSENRRILKKTEEYSFELIPIHFNLEMQKQIFTWLKVLQWDFPISSVKTVFTHHLFNYLYIWKKDQQVVAFSVCYFSPQISHIAYVFYDPEYSHLDLPIRLVLQFVIDSQQKNLQFAYLGRIANYKKNMPGYEYYSAGEWIK